MIDTLTHYIGGERVAGDNHHSSINPPVAGESSPLFRRRLVDGPPLSDAVDLQDQVHAAGKRWYAPLSPGYNSQLLNGDGNCVPRGYGETLRRIWTGNSASRPDGWGVISWNEVAENTHIRPMQKWGYFYLRLLTELMNSTP